MEMETDTQLPFVADDFDVPSVLVTSRFRLEPLGVQHHAADYAAWTGSMEHIRATPGFDGSGWPCEMTEEQNRADLARHAADFAERRGFTYTVLEPPVDGDVIGCVYLYRAGTYFPRPDGAGGWHDADVRSWVRADRAGLDAVLYAEVRTWLAERWPFTAPRYHAR
jgi:hypothetical protein